MSSASQSQTGERMWPLDVAIAAVAGLGLYLIATRLSFVDPAWQRNAWTYVIAVPLIAIVMSFFVRGVTSRYFQKSLQLGFLASVLAHLLLLTLAVNVIIFSRYFPDAFTGVKPERSPVRRTVPEYLFRTPEQRTTQPDWSKPTETETASPVVPREQRTLPPVQNTAPTLEVPQPRDPIDRPMQEHLMKRDTPAESLPQPSDSPSKLARRNPSPTEAITPAGEAPTAPKVPVQAEMAPTNIERRAETVDRSEPSRSAVSMADLPAMPTQVSPKPTPPALAGVRSSTAALPKVGDAGLQRDRRSRGSDRRPQPVGAAPAAPTVAIARADAAADRMLSPIETPPQRTSRATGASMAMADLPAALPSDSDQPEPVGMQAIDRDYSAMAGVPDVSAGSEMRAPGRASRTSGGRGFDPVGKPDIRGDVAAATRSTTQNQSSSGGDPQARPLTAQPVRRNAESNIADATAAAMAVPDFTLPAMDGPIGLSDLPGRTTGVVPSLDAPTIAAMDLTTGTRRRRDVGGPVTPFGTKIAAVESFSRRVMRTEGGATTTPAGLVGPATEEAIERGLQYLASIQNEDGSWSLQGHGSEVVLKGDSAATGLSLLSFQGAGYTHREHQYADTVSRGLKFLLDNQRTNGDLYRSEDDLSNRNVAFYSHGIASLALCEAYGMTQDEDLKQPAQLCLDYIAATQNRTRGGWRYTPQVSSDTSVSGWMMMALKSGQLSGLEVSQRTYDGIEDWLELAKSPGREDRYRYNPYAPDTPSQRHGRLPTPTMTAVGMLMRMYGGWKRETPAMQSAADYLLEYPPQMGTPQSPAAGRILLVLRDAGDVPHGRSSLEGLECVAEPGAAGKPVGRRSVRGQLGPGPAGARSMEHPCGPVVRDDDEPVELRSLLSSPADLRRHGGVKQLSLSRASGDRQQPRSGGIRVARGKSDKRQRDGRSPWNPSRNQFPPASARRLRRRADAGGWTLGSQNQGFHRSSLTLVRFHPWLFLCRRYAANLSCLQNSSRWHDQVRHQQSANNRYRDDDRGERELDAFDRLLFQQRRQRSIAERSGDQDDHARGQRHQRRSIAKTRVKVAATADDQ